jgi:hypothetical protein
MGEIRLDETYDGLCTVTIGASVVVTDLTREQAEGLVARYRQVNRA